MQSQTPEPGAEQAGRKDLARNRSLEPREFASNVLQLPPLPYDYAALEPYISRRTMMFHHDRHHRAYVEKTGELIADTELEDQDLPEIIRAARAGDHQELLNQAGQAWNHNLFWLSMKPDGGGAPEGRLLAMIERDLGGADGVREAFREEATSHFASGWAWLCLINGKLKVTSFHDGDTPAGRNGVTPLLTCDLWEHAYYLDYQNRRPDFVDAFLDHLISWDCAAANLPSDA